MRTDWLSLGFPPSSNRTGLYLCPGPDTVLTVAEETKWRVQQGLSTFQAAIE